MKRSYSALACGLIFACLLFFTPIPAKADWNIHGNDDEATAFVVGVVFVVVIVALVSSNNGGYGRRHRRRDYSRKIDGLVKQVADTKNKKPEAAEEQLIAIGAPALDKVIALCGNNDPVIRFRAANVLGGIKDPRAQQQLNKMLADEDATVKSAALQGINAAGDKRAEKEAKATPAADKGQPANADVAMASAK